MSEPIITSELPTKRIADYDFTFIGGKQFSLTVGDGDSVNIDSVDITVDHHDDTGGVAEHIVVQRRHLLFYSVKHRTITVYPPGKSPLELAMAEMAAERSKLTR